LEAVAANSGAAVSGLLDAELVAKLWWECPRDFLDRRNETVVSSCHMEQLAGLAIPGYSDLGQSAHKNLLEEVEAEKLVLHLGVVEMSLSDAHIDAGNEEKRGTQPVGNLHSDGTYWKRGPSAPRCLYSPGYDEGCSRAVIMWYKSARCWSSRYRWYVFAVPSSVEKIYPCGLIVTSRTNHGIEQELIDSSR
jgi:hypothetical protein